MFDDHHPLPHNTPNLSRDRVRVPLLKFSSLTHAKLLPRNSPRVLHLHSVTRQDSIPLPRPPTKSVRSLAPQSDLPTESQTIWHLATLQIPFPASRRHQLDAQSPQLPAIPLTKLLFPGDPSRYHFRSTVSQQTSAHPLLILPSRHRNSTAASPKLTPHLPAKAPPSSADVMELRIL